MRNMGGALTLTNCIKFSEALRLKYKKEKFKRVQYPFVRATNIFNLCSCTGCV